MLTFKSHMTHLRTKRFGALSTVYSCELQGQPSTDRFAGILPANWEGAGP